MRGLLCCGVAGGPLFVLVFLINDRIKDDYDPVRDFVSEAAIGPGGWLQIASFLVTGTLMMLFAVGVSRAVSPWTGRLVGLFGAGLVLAGVFVTDSAPTDVSTWHGKAHTIVSVVVFVALAAACFTAARWRPTPAWRRWCRTVGVAVPVLFVLAGGIASATGVLQRVYLTVSFAWLAALALLALRRGQLADHEVDLREVQGGLAKPG
jgi:hypothetical protein